jgi:hypothetical protein
MHHDLIGELKIKTRITLRRDPNGREWCKDLTLATIHGVLYGEHEEELAKWRELNPRFADGRAHAQWIYTEYID